MPATAKSVRLRYLAPHVLMGIFVNRPFCVRRVRPVVRHALLIQSVAFAWMDITTRTVLLVQLVEIIVRFAHPVFKLLILTLLHIIIKLFLKYFFD